jgi:hypothetical protein
MKNIKLVNILKETVVEMYPHEGSMDVGTIEFGRANVWSKFDRPINVYFNDLSVSPNEVANASKIVLTDKKSGEDYLFDADDLKIKNDKMWVSVNDLRQLYPRFLETLLVKSDKRKSENLSVNTLKTKASGIPQLILDVLKEVYPNNWGKIDEPGCQTLEGVIDIFPAMEGERWSILNFFDTNPGVIRILVEKYQDENDEVTLEGFKDYLRENKEELFGKESPILQSLVKRNLQSFERGWKTEAEVIDIVKRENPTLTDEDISQYCLGSVEDRVSGVDFKVKGKGYQTKPASKMERLKNGGVRVQTYGMRDWYQRKKEIDYILYSNGKSIAVFPNKNYKVSNDGKTVTHFENIAKGTFG